MHPNGGAHPSSAIPPPRALGGHVPLAPMHGTPLSESNNLKLASLKFLINSVNGGHA